MNKVEQYLAFIREAEGLKSIPHLMELHGPS